MIQQVAAEKAAEAALRAQEIADRPGVVLSFADAVALANMWATVASELVFERTREVTAEEQTRVLPAPVMCHCRRALSMHPYDPSKGCP